jgi:hypothetical protein
MINLSEDRRERPRELPLRATIAEVHHLADSRHHQPALHHHRAYGVLGRCEIRDVKSTDRSRGHNKHAAGPHARGIRTPKSLLAAIIKGKWVCVICCTLLSKKDNLCLLFVCYNFRWTGRWCQSAIAASGGMSTVKVTRLSLLSIWLYVALTLQYNIK